MCVIYLAYKQHPDYPLILLANRDEFYDRPTAQAAYWDDFSEIYAGRDLVAGGTWLGVTKTGRFAAVTNYRDPKAPTGTTSRGNLVADFLRSDIPAADYLSKVQAAAHRYSGFNLIVGELNKLTTEIFYFSNRGAGIKKLEHGIYGLSNHLLDAPWPKVADGKARFIEIITAAELRKESLFELLSDRTLAAHEDLPDTGIGYEREKALSAIFIKTPNYGTRSSTVLTFDREFNFEFEERAFV